MAHVRPPMGWNSWDCFGGSVTEVEVLANAAFLHDHLVSFGWDTVVVDIQWYEDTPGAHDYNLRADPVLDPWGRQLPSVRRFPSSAGGAGFAPLARSVHDLGLRFGVHVMRGVPRAAVDRGLPVHGTAWTCDEIADPADICAWNPDNFGLRHDHPGAQAWYDAQVSLFAQWGVDFIKLDDVLYPFAQSDIQAYATAIARSGRDMQLSLSPGCELSLVHRDVLDRCADMWRISDDLWDRWTDVAEQFQRLARWSAAGVRDGHLDADMLPLGRLAVRAHVGVERDSELTLEEQRTMLSLWCIARSPLFLGGHLPRSRRDTLDLLTNRDILALLTSTGGREIIRDHDLVVWAADHDDDGERSVAVFWLGDQPTRHRIRRPDVGLDAGGVRDLWRGDALSADDLDLDIPAHGTRVLRGRRR